jgi:hypothetical protein
MNVLDLFFKKFSYKFPKGYPDMKNEQDILLLESLVSKILGEEIVLEKKLEWKDLSDETRKYYRLEVIADKIANEGPFKLENGKEEVLKFDKDSYAALFKAQNVNDIRNAGGKSINKFPFFRDSQGNAIGLSDLTKTKDLGSSGGSKADTSERQERGLIDAINSVPGTKNLEGANEVTIKNIVKADKVPNPAKAEAYADIKLILKDGEYLLSAKGLATPSIAGGGLTGITQISPELAAFVKKFYEDAYAYYKKIFDENEKVDYNTNLYKTDYFKDVNREVPSELVLDMLKGNAAMGGPVDGYYIGPMDVEFTVDNNTIKTNGDIISVEAFADKYKKIYAHIKKRSGDYYFTDATQTIGDYTMPLIFTDKPGGKMAKSRFGVNIVPRGKIII